MSSEVFSFLFPRLFAAGALDVYLTHIIMKKNRPGIKLSVLAHDKDCKNLEGIVFRETTTLGIRRYPVERTALERQYITVDTLYGPITVKAGLQNGSVIKYAPEYEDCSRQAASHGVPLLEVYREAQQEAQKRFRTATDELS